MSAVPAAAAAAKIPWDILVPIFLSLLPSLFGGDSEEKKREEMSRELMALIKPEYSRYTSAIQGVDPIIQKALMGRLDQTKGWGWPSLGMGG